MPLVALQSGLQNLWYFLLLPLTLFSGLATVPLLIILLALSYNKTTWQHVMGHYTWPNIDKTYLSWIAYIVISGVIVSGISSHAELTIKLCLYHIIAMYFITHQPKITKHNITALIVGGILALSLVLFELYSNNLLYQLGNATTYWPPYYKHEYANAVHLNRGLCFFSIIIWVIAYINIHKGRPKSTILLLLLVFTLFLILESQSALLAYSAGAVVFVLARFIHRYIFLILLGLFLANALIFPTLTFNLQPEKVIQTLSSILPFSHKHRIHIWSFTSNKIKENSLLGRGVHASKNIEVAPEDYITEPWVQMGRLHPLPLHPHNYILHIWLELGLIGFLIFTAFIGRLLYRLHKLQMGKAEASCIAAFITSYFAILQFGFGIWQNWLLASAVLTISLMSVMIKNKQLLIKLQCFVNNDRQ